VHRGRLPRKGGYEVTLCDILPELLKPAKRRGIILEGAENLQQTVSETTTNIDDLASDPPDAVIITVKANALPLIASAIQEFQQEGMYVVSWQNGIDTELELANVLGKSPVMRAVVNYGCGLKGPAHVVIPFHHPPHYIQQLEDTATAAAEAITQALSGCGLETHHTDEIISMVCARAL